MLNKGDVYMYREDKSIAIQLNDGIVSFYSLDSSNAIESVYYEWDRENICMNDLYVVADDGLIFDCKRFIEWEENED